MPKLPRYCHWNNSGGNKFLRFRKGSFSTYLTGKPWSDEFMHQYANALEGIKRPRRRIVDNFWHYADKKGSKECWPWTRQIDREGYGRAQSKNDADVLTHRHAWKLSNGPIPKGLHVLHRCDNPACCNPAHLFLGTHADNMKDRNRKQRQYSKITENDVRKIRQSHAGGISYAQLARDYGLEATSVSLICRKINWKHVT